MNNGGRRGGIVGPLILIAIGIILLLNNLNVTDISLVELGFKLWPALIIAFGLDLLVPRSSVWTTLLALVLIAGVLLGSLWLSNAVENDPVGGSQLSFPLEGAERAVIRLNPAVGELVLSGGGQDKTLINGTIRGRFPDKPELEVQAADGQVSLALSSAWERFNYFEGSLASPRWDLRLSDQVPIVLSADMGVGTILLDLRQLDLSELKVNLGVGRARVQLPDDQSLQAVLDGGVGEIEVVLPAGADVEIRLDRGIATLQLPPGYTVEGDVIRSPANQGGEAAIQLSLDLGIGLIRVSESR